MQRPRTRIALLSTLLAAACVGPVLRYEVPQGTRVDLAFEGVESLSRRVLAGRLAPLLRELSREPAKTVLAEKAADLVDAIYRSQGFADVRVEAETEEVEGGLRLALRVVEGPEVFVDEMRLSGNEAFDTDLLLRYWRRRASGALGLGSPYYVEKDVAAFVKALGAHYRSAGYLAVRVAEPRVERDANSVRIVVEIDEGPRYTLERFVVADALREAAGPGLSDPELGEPFDERAIRVYGDALTKRLRRRGWPQPKVAVRILGNDDRHAVAALVEGEPGPTGTFAELAFEGLELTPEGWLRARVGLPIGARYSSDAEAAAVDSLRKTRRFARIGVRYEWIDEGRLRIVFVLSEVPNRLPLALLGYSSYETLRAGMRYADADFLGSGVDLEAQGVASKRGFASHVELADPDLVSDSVGLRVRGELFRRAMPSYTDRASGVTAALDFASGADFEARGGFRFLRHDDVKTDAVTAVSLPADFDEGLAFVELERSFGGESSATARSKLRASLATGELASDFDYRRLDLLNEAQVELGERLSLTGRVETRLLWTDAPSGSLPLPLRVFGGGELDLRSFREHRLGPKDAFGNSIGGQYANLVSTELSAPLAGPMRFAVFAEAANVGRDVDSWGLSRLRYALGVGLRVPLAIGPLEFDAALNPDREAGEEEWVLHLRIGQRF